MSSPWSKKIKKILDQLYPEPAVPLTHTNNYTLLIAVLLSARCTDARVNLVTPFLFKRASTPQAMIRLKVEEIKDIIQSCGLSPQKSKAIWELSKILIEHYEGEVPNSFEALESLPGVGHKTASVVMTQAFHQAAFPVDTHIFRLAKRWGLTEGRNVKQAEADLKQHFDPKDWGRIHLQMIYFGREFCKARQHDPERCPICLHLIKKPKQGSVK